MSGTYGSNYTIMPAHGSMRWVQLKTTHALIDAPRELRPLYSYEWYDDAVVIYRRDSMQLDIMYPWERVGVILFAGTPDAPTKLIYALEVDEGYERGDVEPHIPLLFDPL